MKIQSAILGFSLGIAICFSQANAQPKLQSNDSTVNAINVSFSDAQLNQALDLLKPKPTTNPGWWGLFGAVIGGLLTLTTQFLVTYYNEERERKLRLKDNITQALGYGVAVVQRTQDNLDYDVEQMYWYRCTAISKKALKEGQANKPTETALIESLRTDYQDDWAQYKGSIDKMTSNYYMLSEAISSFSKPIAEFLLEFKNDQNLKSLFDELVNNPLPSYDYTFFKSKGTQDELTECYDSELTNWGKQIESVKDRVNSIQNRLQELYKSRYK